MSVGPAIAAARKGHAGAPFARPRRSLYPGECRNAAKPDPSPARAAGRIRGRVVAQDPAGKRWIFLQNEGILRGTWQFMTANRSAGRRTDAAKPENRRNGERNVYDLGDERAGEKTSRERAPLERTLADEARFIRTLFESPRLTGAISPSGPFLARAMARAVDPRQPGLVVELGPGTGPVTKALIERGVPAERLALVEYDAAFCRLLAQRFPGVRLIQGDAYALSQTLAELAD